MRHSDPLSIDRETESQSSEVTAQVTCVIIGRLSFTLAPKPRFSLLMPASETGLRISFPHTVVLAHLTALLIVIKSSETIGERGNINVTLGTEMKIS